MEFPQAIDASNQSAISVDTKPQPKAIGLRIFDATFVGVVVVYAVCAFELYARPSILSHYPHLPHYPHGRLISVPLTPFARMVLYVQLAQLCVLILQLLVRNIDYSYVKKAAEAFRVLVFIVTAYVFVRWALR